MVGFVKLGWFLGVKGINKQDAWLVCGASCCDMRSIWNLVLLLCFVRVWGLKREGLEYVAELFFYLFEFVLHFYHQFLYLYVVGFRPDSVDFAAHFLCHKCQLLAVAFVGVHGLAEVVDVFGEANFFFGDVVFLKIIDKFLFETVLVYFFDCVFGEVALNAFTGSGDAFFFVLGYLVEFLLNDVYVFVEVVLENGAFVQTELVYFGNGGGDGL